jgi:ferredoxin-thioredoxin reductase catalytic subunit
METESDDYRRIRASVEKSVTKYAERSPFFLNPDDVVVKNIILGLIRNKLKYGYNYCPCREVKGILKEDAKNICPCRTHKEEITRRGTCECGLFVSKAYFKALTVVE